MPASAFEPSGTAVDVLCGQPEQKYGMRATLARGRASSASFDSMNFNRASMMGEVWNLAMRRAITRATIAGVSSPAAGSSHSERSTSHSPCSSYLPITRGLVQPLSSKSLSAQLSGSLLAVARQVSSLARLITVPSLSVI